MPPYTMTDLPPTHGYHYGPLPEQAQEDALHATRLLNVEERPFQRLTKALLRDTTNPDKLYAEISLDFAAFNNSILRIQSIQTSHARERERYAAEKARILSSASSVRESTVALRAQLADAQQVLSQRKGYDELAAKILDDPKLKAREERRVEIAALEREIAELEAEGARYEGIWATRRELFENVAKVSEDMVRSIKAAKDDALKVPDSPPEKSPLPGHSSLLAKSPMPAHSPLPRGSTIGAASPGEVLEAVQNAPEADVEMEEAPAFEELAPKPEEGQEILLEELVERIQEDSEDQQDNIHTDHSANGEMEVEAGEESMEDAPEFEHKDESPSPQVIPGSELDGVAHYDHADDDSLDLSSVPDELEHQSASKKLSSN
ncbi:hypothetical protein K470DRAFT_271558 [Piedraia hortae CBS 480.64]|uniref:Uncharacterized protein n=1 Tax=Piedraia hortae CBS 480.64 TaxID=1314780 RepID=A0A6A7BWT3_9PEZI|nr:hypothetical protein K470DRAFT_271558 [Piedraia hortae CBS 480.64]